MKINRIILACLIMMAAVPSVMGQTTLAEATKKNFLMGVAVNMPQVNGVNPVETVAICNNFSAVVSENSMKPEPVHPQENRYNWTDADKVVAFAEKNHLTLTGHCLIWHSQIGRWFFVGDSGKEVTPEVLKERMRQHIYTVVGRYKGRIKGWDVVNEAMEDNGTYRKSRFYKILGKDFIKYAFQFAHEADPNAELYYNDYSMEDPTKCDAVIQMVKELKAAGCRIDAVGSQSHMQMESPTFEATETTLKKLKEAGVKILITEWDMSILPSPYTGADIATRFKYTPEKDPYRESIPDSVQQKWNQRMLGMFALFLKYSDVIDRITVWGLNDGGSWMNNFPVPGRKDYATLFDRNNQPKSIVGEMIKMANEYNKKK
jgi:endo-1,4-beta-xylanase